MNAGAGQPIAQSGFGSETRDMLRQSLATVLARHYSFEARDAAYRTPGRHSAAAWHAYAELGLTALGLPEAHGGLPGDLADVALVAEMMGGALVLEPWRASMVAARLLAAAGTPAQHAAWLPGLADGSRKAALVVGDVAAAADREGWRLSGKAAVVPGGDVADLLIVAARLGGETALFAVSAEMATRRGYPCFDWTGAADIAFDGVAVADDRHLAGGTAELAAAQDVATVLACADALGAMRAANALTRDYTRDRKQFGVAIASFQVLQHRMVDMAIAEEMAAAITGAAVAACGGSDPVLRARIVSAAKVKVGDAARLVAQQCVQLHGGMGLAEEYPAAHYFARLGMFERLQGDRDTHLARFMAGG